MAIIVGLSESALGRRAVDRAAQEAARRDLPLVLVTQVTARRNEEDSKTYPDRRGKAEEEVTRRAGELSAGGINCVPYVPSVPASAAEAVLLAAKEHDGELIVVGIRRRSPVGKALLGSTSQAILLQADCDVLGVKLSLEEEDAD